MIFIFDKEKLKDMHDVISLYKTFDRYKDNTREELYYHILPSFKLNQYKIHKDKENNMYAFTNWAFLNDDVEKRFISTGILELEDWKSGSNVWHIDTICGKNMGKVMAWTKQYFKNILKVGQSLNWLRMDANKNIYRQSAKFKREFHK
jgi:hemolysin-activating ACP:hemolysin acyltransferase